MIPVDLSANYEGWIIYDPNGSGERRLALTSRSVLFTSPE